MATKQEYPSLLSPGLHSMSLADLRSLCVDPFPLSQTRPDIMAGLEQTLHRLSATGFDCEVWVDGSFLTEKIDPEDSDVVLCIDGGEFDVAPQHIKDEVDWFAGSDPAQDYKCDSYVCPKFDAAHQLHSFGENLKDYWLKTFGHSRSNDPKGIAVIKLPIKL